MGNTLNPYLNFDGTAREAMTFYQQVLGGRLELMTFAQYGMEGPGSDGIMHAYLGTDDGFTLMASDLPPGMELPTPGAANVNVSLSGDDGEALHRYPGLGTGPGAFAAARHRRSTARTNFGGRPRTGAIAA